MSAKIALHACVCAHATLHLTKEQKESLNDVIKRNMRNNEEDLQCERNEQLSSTERFAALIKNAATKYNKPVVILIDEYDKPLLNSMDNEVLNNDYRATLKAFYSVLKSADRFVRFAFFSALISFSFSRG